MSKIGKKLIPIPQGVTVTIENGVVGVKGPKAELKLNFPPAFSVGVEDQNIYVRPPEPVRKNVRTLWGTTRALIANMVKGVTEGFEKKLVFEGIGYKAEVSGSDLVLSVGFTHPVRMTIPQGMSVVVTKNMITIAGADKERVGQFAAEIRRVRPPEPYKGTGIKYVDEIIKRKAGKKLAGAGTK